ncbi:DUF6318 family protein [uncultured Rothia sp.]|uniref:DUF6318 family protein n=1 Tax=uncultured Rothia sp. TaxID=316088 RepID=UPI00260CAF1D|nr:DUF6318 family protein [uncultured Rothia sp.]
MDSTIFNRRTLLGSGALVGLGALLAACGQQANNEAAATASAAPSETASASAVASESPSASATPSTVRGYSGGSKAPDGEYRKADWQGPAQNVPKPPAPEEGYREKSISGLEKTIRAWVLHGNYSIQTGDYSVTNTFISPSFKEELEFADRMTSLYEKGGWVIDGVHNFVANGAPWSEDGETYIWRAYREWARVMYVQPDGSWESFDNKKGANNMWDIKLRHNGKAWLIESTTLVEE